MTIETPVLKTACRASAGTASSQDGCGYWPKASRIRTSAPREKSSCWSCCRASEIGSEARGKCSARTRPMLPLMARVPHGDRRAGEGPDEDAGDQERHEVRHPVLRLHQDAEDEVVDRRVEQRGHDLPDLAELRLAVLGGELGGGERRDEVPPPPQLPYVRGQGGARPAHGQAVALGERGELTGGVHGRGEGRRGLGRGRGCCLAHHDRFRREAGRRGHGIRAERTRPATGRDRIVATPRVGRTDVGTQPFRRRGL